MPKINTRAKGHTLERYIAKLLREIGFSNCTTSRLTSRAMDHAKVDLCDTGPLYIQAKAVEKLGCVHTILDSMPKHKGKYNIVWHKKNRKGSIVCMTEEDFLFFLTEMIKYGIIKT